MIRCPACNSDKWNQLFRCIVNPANDNFQCRACCHKFMRYDEPTPKKEKSRTPVNAEKHPISDLIAILQKLPPGTTFKYVEDEQHYYGGEVPDRELGTAYQLCVIVVNGFDPPRE